MHILSSSIREVPAHVTTDAAWPVARALGVTRCADVTRLDRIGIPVFCAVRPRAAAVRVTAGKGQRSEEARAGALMEAIEQAVAEYAPLAADAWWATPASVAADGGPTLGSLCPQIGRAVDVDATIAWVTGQEYATGVEVPVPAELVFVPCPATYVSGVFGSSTTTGLASGNTEAEAILHGLCEVLERDVTSFQQLDDSSSVLIAPATLPPEPAGLIEAITTAGLQVWLRSAPAGCGLVYFTCLIVDDDIMTPLACNGGYGCHPMSAIAATRAITEAAQSRLTYIQGARDDLTDHQRFIDAMAPDRRAAYRNELIRRYAQGSSVAFEDIPGAEPAEPDALLEHVVKRCRAAGFDRVLVYRYPGGLSGPLHVVRVVVPRAEHFTQQTQRIGPRLLAAARGLRAARAAP